MEGILNVALSDNSQMPYHLYRDGSQHVVFGIAQRLTRSHDDTLTSVNTHRVQVFHVANRYTVVVPVANNLVLNFFPSCQVFLDQNLRAVCQGFLCTFTHCRLIRAKAGAESSQSVGHAKHHRIADFAGYANCLVNGIGGSASRHFYGDFRQLLNEQLSILGRSYSLNRRAQHLDPVALQHALFFQSETAVERRLSAESKQNAVGPFLLNYLLNEDRIDRQEIDLI